MYFQLLARRFAVRFILSSVGLFLLVVFLPFRSSASALDRELMDEWNSSNNPALLNSQYEHRFSAMPLNADLGWRPWADTYWPSRDAGIAARPGKKGKSNFEYKLLSRTQVARASFEQLKALSPAEKYDILNGHYDYPMVQRERKRSNPDAWEWEGICHGWAPAAIHYPEPLPKTVKNADGVEIPFGSSDIKGLISTFYAGPADSPSVQLGSRCFVTFKKSPFARLMGACSDTNAGAFHIVLANQIGLMKQPFIADIVRDKEVWNHPIYKYDSQVTGQRAPSNRAAEGTYKEILVKTTMEFTDEIEPSFDPVAGTSLFKAKKAEYLYWLELDRSSRILGGSWESWERPDFLWINEKVPFQGMWQGVNNLLDAE